jgi:hypothetical protein
MLIKYLKLFILLKVINTYVNATVINQMDKKGKLIVIFLSMLCNFYRIKNNSNL